MLQVNHNAKYIQPIWTTYINIFALSQTIDLQIMATWVHLSTYLLFVINLAPFKLFYTESAVFRTASVKYTDLKSPRQRNTFFFLKNHFNITMTLRRYSLSQTQSYRKECFYQTCCICCFFIYGNKIKMKNIFVCYFIQMLKLSNNFLKKILRNCLKISK